MTAVENIGVSTSPDVVVFGRDDAGKPHASSFVEGEVALATKAAGLMGLRLMRVVSETDLALAVRVPKGKVFGSGRAFVPFVKAALYAELELACPGGAATSQGSSKRTAAAASTKPDEVGADEAVVSLQPTNWDGIQAGSIVLAAAAPLHQTWFECVVTKVVGGDLLSLRFCDWPNEEPFTRHRNEVGLINPSREVDPPLEAAPSQSAAA